MDLNCLGIVLCNKSGARNHCGEDGNWFGLSTFVRSLRCFSSACFLMFFFAYTYYHPYKSYSLNVTCYIKYRESQGEGTANGNCS